MGSPRVPISTNPADNAPYSNPHRGWIISPPLVAIFSIVPTILIALFFNIRLISLWDFTNSIMATVYAIIFAECANVLLKTFVTAFRPYFLTVCDPDPDLVAAGGRGFGGLYFNIDICRQPDMRLLKQSMTSFPSGHATCAFAGLGVLFLYLNGKLKPWGNYRPMSWEVPVVVAPLIGATLISCSVLVNADHHVADVIAGAAIGIASALAMYRALFASIWDWRFNHIPLRPREVLRYEVAGENLEGVVLHKGVWEGRVARNFEGRKTGYWTRVISQGVGAGGLDGGRGAAEDDSAEPGGAGGGRVAGDQMV